MADLSTGMYVARLDVPWLDTPFTVQGFFLETQSDINRICEYCSVVYVDPRRVQENGRFAPKLTLEQGRGGVIDTGVRKYVDSVPMKDEFASIQGEYENASQSVAGAFERVREGGVLDVPAVSKAVMSMMDSVLRNREALAALVRMKRKDNYVYSHCLATAVWSTLLGRHLGLNEKQLGHVALGAALIDIGKVKLPDDILGKPKRLNESEWALVQRHVEYGVELVENAQHVDATVLGIVQHHHERHDGSGYPAGISDTAIPIAARISGIADSYDAMITNRPFAKARSSFEAMQELNRLKGTKFQAELIEQFMQAIGLFPTGAIVELNSGEVAIVVAQNPTRRLKPKVVMVLDANKQRLTDFVTIDLLKYQGDRDLWISQELESSAYGINAQEYFL